MNVARTVVFEGHPITFLTWRGRACWVARQIGAALGYCEDGKRLANKVTGAWRRAFLQGDDFQVLVGDELAEVKKALGDALDPQTSSLLVLFESGLQIVLERSAKAAARRLRDVLASTPPTEEPASAAAPSAAPAAPASSPAQEPTPGGASRFHDREARLLAQHELRERKFHSAALRDVVRTLHWLGRMDTNARIDWEIRIAEMALGRSLPELRAPTPSDGWSSPMQIASVLGTTDRVVARAAVRIGLYGDVAGLCRGLPNDPSTWRFSPLAVARIIDALRNVRPVGAEA